MRDFAKIFRDEQGRQVLVYVDPSNEDDQPDLLRIVAQRDEIVTTVSLGFASAELAYTALDKMEERKATGVITPLADAFDPQGGK